MNLLILLGPTCSGKSEMAVDLAQFFSAQNQTAVIASCDSRQVYKDLNLGTGKVEGRWQTKEILDFQGNLNREEIFFYRGVEHFLLDFLDPQKQYTLVDFVQDFAALIQNLQKRKKPPQWLIITGGTGLYAKAVAEKYDLGLILPQFTELFETEKNKLSQTSLEILQKLYLKKLKKEADLELNYSDFQNPRRLQNWLLRQKAKSQNWQQKVYYSEFDQIFQFAIQTDYSSLKPKIAHRLEQRIDWGLLEEIENLLPKIGHQRLWDLGLEYRQSLRFLNGEISEIEWKEQMLLDNYHYAKRQLTWLKKQNLTWVNSPKEILAEIGIV